MADSKVTGILKDSRAMENLGGRINMLAGDTLQITAPQLLERLVEDVKKSLGYLERPLIKCRHCGQWGAAFCPCRHCGAPIDPPGS
jgi:hypothetical protein